jgi:hypothetical protein
MTEMTATAQIHFFKSLKQERNIESARADAREYMRDAHDLCCWPIQAAAVRAKAEAIYADIREIEARNQKG